LSWYVPETDTWYRLPSAWYCVPAPYPVWQMLHFAGASASVSEEMSKAAKWALCAPASGQGFPAPWPWQDMQVVESSVPQAGVVLLKWQLTLLQFLLPPLKAPSSGWDGERRVPIEPERRFTVPSVWSYPNVSVAARWQSVQVSVASPLTGLTGSAPRLIIPCFE
jgi:hypothetical protein